jgi:hypothetical protein
MKDEKKVEKKEMKNRTKGGVRKIKKRRMREENKKKKGKENRSVAQEEK